MLTKIIIALVLLAMLGWLLRRPARKPAAPDQLAEARALLGVEADADADAIRAAHRRLVARVHPDQGGTQELARRVNAARDVLLSQLRH